MDSVIFLISKTYEEDGIGQQFSAETKRKIFCTVESVKQSEFYNAGQQGFKPELTAIVYSFEYEGETEAVIDGENYSVYRTFRRNDDRTELYLTKKAGA